MNQLNSGIDAQAFLSRWVQQSEDDKGRLMRAWYEPEPWPDTREGLERLKNKGYILATMSNASIRMQKIISE